MMKTVIMADCKFSGKLSVGGTPPHAPELDHMHGSKQQATAKWNES